jgi:hypothetical protein
MPERRGCRIPHSAFRIPNDKRDHRCYERVRNRIVPFVTGETGGPAPGKSGLNARSHLT